MLCRDTWRAGDAGIELSDMYEAMEERDVCDRLAPAHIHSRAHTHTMSIALQTKAKQAQRLSSAFRHGTSSLQDLTRTGVDPLGPVRPHQRRRPCLHSGTLVKATQICGG